MGLACLVLPLGRAKIRETRRFAWFQLSLDLVLITAVVAVTGGAQSIFVPLYVLAVVAACFVLSRAGALIVAGLSSLLHDRARGRQERRRPAGPRRARGHDRPGSSRRHAQRSGAARRLDRDRVARRAVPAVTGASRNPPQAPLGRPGLPRSDLRISRLGTRRRSTPRRASPPSIERPNRSPASKRREALGQPWAAIFGRGRRSGQRCAGPPISREIFRCVTSSASGGTTGVEVPVGITFWALRSGGGDNVGLIGVCQDLSLIKQMEERMRQADRLAAVGRLSANMAHEIRNPLASISGAVQMLVKDLPARLAARPSGRDRAAGNRDGSTIWSGTSSTTRALRPWRRSRSTCLNCSTRCCS